MTSSEIRTLYGTHDIAAQKHDKLTDIRKPAAFGPLALCAKQPHHAQEVREGDAAVQDISQQKGGQRQLCRHQPFASPAEQACHELALRSRMR
jgi:hypothetical protein